MTCSEKQDDLFGSNKSLKAVLAAMESFSGEQDVWKTCSVQPNVHKVQSCGPGKYLRVSYIAAQK